jgi:hypothetical protein
MAAGFEHTYPLAGTSPIGLVRDTDFRNELAGA